MPTPPTQTTPPKRRKPLGRAIRHTDEELDQLSQVTPADQEAANALWKGAVTPKLQNLLEAKQEDNSTNA